MKSYISVNELLAPNKTLSFRTFPFPIEMADSVVTFLLQNLTQLLAQESKLLGGVENQVRLLKNELSLINVFLQNTKGKQHGNELVKQVVSQIRDVAYEAEDIIDTFIVTMTKHRRRGKLRKVIHCFDRVIALHEVANKIENIKNVIKEIYDNQSKYGIEIAESSRGDAEVEEILHRRRRYVEVDDVDKLKGTLIEDLKVIEEMSDEECKKTLSEVLMLKNAEERIQDHITKISQDQKLNKLISIHHANQPYISSSPCKPSNSRSIIGFGGVVELESPPDNCYLEWICKSNKLVRVVELSNMGICCLIPDRIENLILLRYLSIRSGELHVIPDSVCKLCNLETLDMRDSIIRRLPRGIWKLQKLRHLYLNGRTSLPITDNDAALPNIQVLTGIAVNQDIENLFAKGRFPNVRKLGLYSSRALESKLLSSLHPLCHLQTLKIYFDLFEVSSPISFYSTLTKITLLCASLSPASLGVLGSLTNLRILKVRGVMDVRFQFTLDCNESSFHQLEVFKIEKVDVLQWTMEKGAMPSLQRLVIEGCDFHIMPPRELWCLTALRDVEVLYPSQKLAKMLQKLRTRDGCKLHVYPPN
ncbi:putative disease resistance protein rxw24l [Quercus suber]|uniref:Disease resistance protein rxw24l n=1 Tax=Quercus suber TaxID=58331 RepID=A0AAW0K6W2_QUESU